MKREKAGGKVIKPLSLSNGDVAETAGKNLSDIPRDEEGGGRKMRKK